MASLENTGGTFGNTGTVSGTTSISGGTVTNTGAGDLQGAVTISGGTLESSADAGAIENQAAGTLTLQAGSTSGAVSNAGTATNGGTVASLENTGGTFGNTGTVSGTTSISGGTVTNTGVLTGDTTITGGTLVSSGTLGAATNTGGALEVTGGTSGVLTNTSGSLDVSGGVVASLVNADTATNSGTIVDLSQIGGTFSNSGSVTGTATISSGTVTNAGTLGGTVSLTGGTLTSTGTLGDVVNDGGLLTITDGSTGDLTNANGTLTFDNSVTVNGTLANNAGQTLTLGDDDDATDIVQVNGNANLNGTVRLGIGNVNGEIQADRINATGAVRGAPTFDFSLTQGATVQDVVDAGAVDLVGYGTGTTLTPTLSGDLAENVDPSLVFVLENNAASNQWQVEATANPAVGGLASGVTLTQSLIGVIVNRPTSPFVTALAIAEEDTCGFGTWGRATGGNAEATGSTTTSLTTADNTIRATYAGVQVGADYNCSGGEFNGWDLSFGAIAGVNRGQTEQDIFAFNGTTLEFDLSQRTNVIENDFTQSYLGGYVTAARNRFVADLQLRYENTDFELTNNELIAGQGVSFLDQDYSSNGLTLSGSVGYSIPIPQTDGLIFATSAGFSVSRSSVDDLAIDVTSGGTTTNGLVEIDDIETRVAFASATLAFSRIAPSGTAAFNFFGTATYYADFTPDTEARLFTDVSVPNAVPLTSSSSSFGDYGEISLGLSYTKIIEPGTVGALKQFDASIRLDGRASADLSSYGLTAQARLQF